MLIAATDLAVRTLERAERTAEVLAPRAWADAQVEAWLDGADLYDPALPLGGALHAYTARLGLAGPRAEALRMSMLHGLAAAGTPARLRVQVAAEETVREALEAHLARRRGAALAAGASAVLGRRL